MEGSLKLAQVFLNIWFWHVHVYLFLTLGAHAHEGYGCLFVCLSVCLLPVYCLRMTFMQQNERTSQFCAEFQRFSTKGFR